MEVLFIIINIYIHYMSILLSPYFRNTYTTSAIEYLFSSSTVIIPLIKVFSQPYTSMWGGNIIYSLILFIRPYKLSVCCHGYKLYNIL